MAKVYKAQPHIRNWMPSQIDLAHTINTGGNVMADVITLKDGKVLVVTDECIALYPSMDAWCDGPSPEEAGYPMIDRNPS